ncbi:universal stress protein [Agromyces sp. ZXT2-6]|uniref:universal stress protein n=1 Tax=Agromyces sp. ZXT2-6 TaxID=3461153 RepID=UPI00405517C0
MPDPAQRTLVVGVMAAQPDAVATQAAALAAQLGTRLVCATVDAGRYVVEERPDGGIRSAPFDPDLADADAAFADADADAGTANGADAAVDRVDPELEARLHALLDPTGVAWETRALAGDPARALARLAETLDAMMIVVGTREGGLRGTLHELFNGSVAAHLAHRQHRPVVVIPLSPVGLGAALPWESDS